MAALAISLAGCAGYAGCAETAATPVAAAQRQPQPHQASGESELLGPFTKTGCFHVVLAGPDRYHFMIDEVDYPLGLGSEQVGISVYAVGIGALEPQLIKLPRLRRLEFEAAGQASGAFELTLFLVDGQGNESQSLRLTEICGPGGNRP